MPAADEMTIDERRKYVKLMANRYQHAKRKQRSQLLTEMEQVLTRIATCTDFAVQLGGVARPLAPALQEIVFIRIKLAGPQGARSRQRRLWSPSEILAHGIAGQAQFFPDLAQAHASCVQFLHPLIQLPLA